MNTETRFKAPAVKQRLTDAFLRHLKPTDRTRMVWDDKQSGFGVQITPMGTISFKVTYRHKNRLRWYTIDKYPSIGLADARKIAQEIRYQAARRDRQYPHGRDTQADEVADREGDTLKDVSARYVEEYAKLNNKSWKQAENLMAVYILPKLGSRLITDITQSDIRGIFKRLTIAKNRPIVANQSLAAVSAVLRWAKQQQIIEQNVALGIPRNKSSKDERYLSDEEVKLVWPVMIQSLRLVLLTAQRPGEVSAMRWQDIDLVKAVWTLPGAPDGDWPGTKNSRTHLVPLSPQAITILHELEPQEDGPVFSGRIPTTSGLWKKLKIQRFRPHHLRATASTGMSELGFTEEYISRVLNHSKSSVTQSYIRHDHFEQKRRALEVWGNHLQTILEGRPVPSGVVDIRSAR